MSINHRNTDITLVVGEVEQQTYIYGYVLGNHARIEAGI